MCIKNMNNIENTPPINVLLPTCNETNIDVFIEILKSVVLHTRLHDNAHIQSMISGMAGETFQIDEDDLSVDWKRLTSHSRQIRQSKLLGFWAARHYPLIGKKLIGAAWQPPKECNVQVNELIEIAQEEIDNIVSMKMKLRIIELNVCEGTSKKLNYFVRAPVGVGKVKHTTLSSKMIAFDIESEYLEKCWEALKLGGLPSNFEKHMNLTAFKAPQPSIVTSHLTNRSIDQHQIVRRNSDQSTAEKRNSISTRLSDALSPSTQVSVMSKCNVQLTDISASTARNNFASETKTIPSAKRARCVTPNSSTSMIDDETNIDVLRVAVCEMRKDIQNLVKCLGNNAAENGSERFHLTVFKQKDTEIFKLTESLQRLEKENELLKDDKTKLSGEIEAKSNLIITLQKALEANSKLHGKMEEESNAMSQKLANEDKLKIVMTETNDKLQEELTTVKSRLAFLNYDFQNEKQDLLQKLSATNQLNCELTEMNKKLREELNVATNHSANVESNLQDLVQKLSAAEEVNVKLTKTNGKLEEDLNAANNHFADTELNQQLQIQDLLHKLSAADQINIELTNTNGKLQQESNTMTDYVANKESNFRSAIQDLVHKLSATERTKIELTDSNGKLQQELDEAKIEIKRNENLSETLQNLKARTNILIDQFRARVEETEKLNAQLASKNENLQEELNILNAGKDKDLLFLPKRPETHIQTERKVSVHDGYDQAENIQCIGDNAEKLPEPIDRASNEGHNVEMKNIDQNGSENSFWEEEFVSDDPIVEQCRPVLQRQKFGWMKFHPYKSTKFRPAFVYSVDKDGLEQAQQIKADGYITNSTSPFWEFHFARELPDDMKKSSEVLSLKKFNKKFGAKFT